MHTHYSQEPNESDSRLWVELQITPKRNLLFENMKHTRNESQAITVSSKCVQCFSMILPQVHLRKPCYDFYFLYIDKLEGLPDLVLFLPKQEHAPVSPSISLTNTSVVATGGVYKGQGRIQRKLMTRIYKEFLVHALRLQSAIPEEKEIQRLPDSFQSR